MMIAKRLAGLLAAFGLAVLAGIAPVRSQTPAAPIEITD
jgi:hypothetical protein